MRIPPIFIKYKQWISLVIGLTMTGVTLLIFYLLNIQENKQLKNLIKQQLETNSNEITYQIDSRISVLERMVKTLAISARNE